MLNARTSLIINNTYGLDNNVLDIAPYYYRLRNCDTNMTANTPANQYQRQKIIQNTVRVYASLYTANLGPLTAYTKPPAKPYGGVCWNQMSDRPFPSVQKTYVPTGSNCSLNKKHTSVTSSRPGGQSPGGIGCDIKHNSYDRYLNRLKGKGPLRQDIPFGIGVPKIQYNPAYPIYGGKVMKTNIVNGCNCPIIPKPANTDSVVYYNPLFKNFNDVVARFGVGTAVYAIETSNVDSKSNSNNPIYSKAVILSIDDTTGTDIYTIEFEDGTVEQQYLGQLRTYFTCNCDTTVGIENNSSVRIGSSVYGVDCIYPTQQAGNIVL